MITIKVFGQLTDIMGADPLEIEQGSSIAELKLQLIDRFPLLATKKFNFALNNKIADEDAMIGNEALVYLLPPYSGG